MHHCPKINGLQGNNKNNNKNGKGHLVPQKKDWIRKPSIPKTISLNYLKKNSLQNKLFKKSVMQKILVVVETKNQFEPRFEKMTNY